MQRYDPLAPDNLAEYLGVRLWKLRDIDGLPTGSIRVLTKQGRNDWSAVTVALAGVSVVVCNPTHSESRQASSIMHELAHILLEHKHSTLLISPDGEIALREYDRTQEDEAVWLAGCLLLPREALLYMERTGMQEDEARARYGVSRQLLTSRRNMTGARYQVQRGRSIARTSR